MKRGGELKRTKGLKRSAPKPKARIPHNVRRAVNRRQNWCCVACGRPGMLLVHHVLPQEKWPEHAEQMMNMVSIHPECHANHHAASRRIRYDELPEQVRTWIRTLGGRETLYTERTYPR